MVIRSYVCSGVTEDRQVYHWLYVSDCIEAGFDDNFYKVGTRHECISVGW